MQRKLGIIAGGGSIPKMLVRHCQQTGREFFVLAIEGNAAKDFLTDDIPHQWIRIGQAGTGFKRFGEEKVQDVVMVSNRTVTTENGKSYVKVKNEDGSISTVEVETGFSNGSMVEIVSGLEEGQIALIESKVSS